MQVTKAHTGPIHSPVAGRTDHLPMNVPSGSYVIPADIISGLGEGNTTAGFKMAKMLFGDTGAVAAGENSVPIVGAGGEFVVHPNRVRLIGKGNMDDGHSVLDEFVEQYRAKLVKTLKALPGPRRD